MRPRVDLMAAARNRSHGPARRGGFGAFGPDTLREWPDFERSKMADCCLLAGVIPAGL